MTHKKIPMQHDKKIALVAHDNKKHDLVEWAKYNRVLLAHHKVYATGTTGTILEKELGLEVTRFQSGPLGGDQQIGAKIVDGDIDFLIFFWDPLAPPAARPGRQGAAAHGGGMEHPDRLQPRLGGLHDLVPADGREIRPSRAGL